MNLKKLSLCAVAALSGLSMLAVPAKPGLRTVTQPDGTTIKVRLVGDEFYHTYVTEDGQAVERDADGFFRARSKENSRAAKSRAVARRNSAERPRKATQVPVTGSPRVPVLLLQYSDVKFIDADPKATFTNFFEEGNESARQYFIDQSNGKYTPVFDIYGPFTLSGKRATYGANNYWGDDIGVGTMVGEGCQGLNSQIDFSKYDNDGDGECDVVIVIYAGDGEASSYFDDSENAVWPMQWSLSSSDFGKALTLDNTKVNKFAVFNELNGTSTYVKKIDGIGTFCHEFSHCLGLPDFYDVNYSGYFGMGDWSLLDQGCYNNDGYTPIGYSAYEKEFMNWIEIPEADENTFYTMPVFNQKNAATDKAIRLTSSSNKDEYFIIENRAQQGWDKYIRAEGLLISHVTYLASAWENNEVNSSAIQRMTPVPADNRLKMDMEVYEGEIYYLINEDDEKGDLWPYGTSTEFTDTSKPAAALNNGSKLGKPITEITRKADGTVSFWAMKAPKPAVATPLSLTHSAPSTSSLAINWQAGDQNAVTYTILVNKHTDYQRVISTDFGSQDMSWSTSGYSTTEAVDGTNAIRLGSASQTGAVTSPQFYTDASGQITVVLNARYYNNDQSSIKVSLTNTLGTVLASKTIELSQAFTDYVVHFSTDLEIAKVKIETTTKKKRAYIATADVYTGYYEPASGAPSRASETGDADSRTITGITGTSYTVTGLTDGGKYDYRIKAVPVDAENFDSSDWTAYQTVDLSELAAISNVTVENEAAPEYYNLQGLRVNADALTPGIYIVRRGAKAEKIVVR